MKVVVRLRKRGQITIPEEARSAMHLKEGDLLEISVLGIER